MMSHVHKQLIKGVVGRLWAGVFTLAAWASTQGAPPFLLEPLGWGAEAGLASP